MEMLHAKFPKFSGSHCIYVLLTYIEKVIWKVMPTLL